MGCIAPVGLIYMTHLSLLKDQENQPNLVNIPLSHGSVVGFAKKRNPKKESPNLNM